MAPAPPVVDTARLAEIERLLGRRFKPMLAQFQARLADDALLLEDAAAEPVALQRLAHALAGTAGMLGFDELALAATALEEGDDRDRRRAVLAAIARARQAAADMSG